MPININLSSFRFLETGSYKGFLQKMIPLLKRHYKVVESNILPWKVYTSKDLGLEGARWFESSQSKGTFLNFVIALSSSLPFHNFFLAMLYSCLPWTAAVRFAKVYARKVGSDNPNQCNKTCIMSQIQQMKTKLDGCRAVVFTHKVGAIAEKRSQRYVFLFFFCKKFFRYDLYKIPVHIQ